MTDFGGIRSLTRGSFSQVRIHLAWVFVTCPLKQGWRSSGLGREGMAPSLLQLSLPLD